MTPTSIVLRDFLSYEKLDLDLTGVDQMAVVGNVGAGKSTLLDAILWSLWGQSRADSPDQVVRHGADGCRVSTAWVASDGRLVEVTRWRSLKGRGESSLNLSVDHVDATGHTIADTQAKIDALAGASVESLLAGPLMVQGRSDELMRLGPAARKQLVFQLLPGLGRAATIAEQAQRVATMAEGRQRIVAHESEAIETDLEQLLPAKRALKASQEALAEAVAHRDTLLGQATTLQTEGAVLVDRQQRAEKLADQRMQENAMLDRLTSERSERARLADAWRVDAVLEVPVVAGFAVDWKDLGERMQENARLLTEQKQDREMLGIARETAGLVDQVPCHGQGEYAACPLLSAAVRARDTNVPHFEGRLQVLEGALLKVVGADREWNEAQARETQWRRRKEEADAIAVRVERARGRLDDHEPWMEENARQVTETNEAIATIQAEQLRLQQDQARALEVKVALDALTTELYRAKSFIQHREDDVASDARTVTELEKDARRLKELQAELPVVTERLRLHALLARAFGRDGIPTMVLESALGGIETAANDVLARMPNGFTLSLLTQREQKSTDRKRETLDVVLTRDGWEQDYGLSSGGERMQVDFALRIGLSRLFPTWGLLWIDEGWGSQDRDGRDAMIAGMMGTADQFGMQVAVSHVEDVADRFPRRLTVTKTDGVAHASLA